MSRPFSFLETFYVLRRHYDGKFYKHSYGAERGMLWTDIDNASRWNELHELEKRIVQYDSGLKMKDLHKYEAAKIQREVSIADIPPAEETLRRMRWYRVMVDISAKYGLTQNAYSQAMFVEFWENPEAYLQSKKNGILVFGDSVSYRNYISKFSRTDCQRFWGKNNPPQFYDFQDCFTPILKKLFPGNPNMRVNRGFFEAKFPEDAMLLKLSFPFETIIMNFREIHDEALAKFDT